jgi:hypothetical protein
MNLENKYKKNNGFLDILVEQEKNGAYIGYDQFFNQVEIKSSSDIIGDWIRIEDYEVSQNVNTAIF